MVIRLGHCGNCEYWLPYIHYDLLGVCKIREAFTFKDCECDKMFTEREIKGQDFYWCGDCREYVYTDDLPLHKNHSLYLGVYDDPLAYMETYAAD